MAATAAAQQAPADSVAEPAQLRGALLQDIPVDLSREAARFAPGVHEFATRLYVRGRLLSRDIWLDGVPVRSWLEGGELGLEPSLPGLAGVTTAGGSAAFSALDALAYRTRRGGEDLEGSVSVETDRLSPESLSESRTRVRFSVGGPTGMSGLRFFAAGQALGTRYVAGPQGSSDAPLWLMSGTDTTVTLARTAQTPGALGDSVQVAVPGYEEWDGGRTAPLGSTSRYDGVARLSWTRRGGVWADVALHATRDLSTTRPWTGLYDPDEWHGAVRTASVLTLTGGLPLTRRITLDGALSYQHMVSDAGIAAPRASASAVHAGSGFLTSPPEFLATDEMVTPTETMLRAWQAGVSMPVVGEQQRSMLRRMGVEGVSGTLRLNPYGTRTGFPSQGLGAAGEVARRRARESRIYAHLGASVAGRGHDLSGGVEADFTDLQVAAVRFYEGMTPQPILQRPRRFGAWAEDRFTLSRVRIDAGLRLEHVQPDLVGEHFPRDVNFLPDSLRGDDWIVVPGDGPAWERLERLEDCGGAATAARRRNSAGEVVCRNNRFQVESRTTVSPRLRVEMDVASGLAAHASYRRWHGVPQHRQAPEASIVTMSEFEWSSHDDIELGLQYSRQDLQVGLSAFHQRDRGELQLRRIFFADPNTGGSRSVVAAVRQAETSATNGVELTAAGRIGRVLDVATSYTWLDADSQRVAMMHTGYSPSQQSAGAALGFDLGALARPGSTAATVLGDLSLHAVARYAEGPRYTSLINVGSGLAVTASGELVGPIAETEPAERLNASQMPSMRSLDLRIGRGIELAGATARLVAEVRNPLGLTTTHAIFAETGTTENGLYRETQLAELLLEYNGTGVIRDRVIADWPENAVNRYALGQAERRFGNGDGVYTVEEQTRAALAHRELMDGPQWYSSSDTLLRLGIELRF